MRPALIVVAAACAGCAAASTHPNVDHGVTADDLNSFISRGADLEVLAGDLAGFDLAHHDAAAPNDLPSSCIQINEPLAVTPTNWFLGGSASYDTLHTRVQLTPASQDLGGSVFYETAQMTPSFDVKFKYYIGDGSGSDGMAFVFAQAAAATQLGPTGDGSSLGYAGMNGYAIEFDTTGGGPGDINGNHVGFMQASTETHLLVGTPSFMLHCGCERQAEVRFTGDHVTITVDSTMIVDGAVTGFVPANYFFGFTGATGSGTDTHAVRDFHLVIGPVGTCI